MLTPDFRGQEMPLAKVIAERPDVFNHNVETVPRLYPMARRGSRLPALARGCCAMAKEMGGDEVVTKSGPDGRPRRDASTRWSRRSAILREHGVQVLTVGQYLRPTENHLPVVRYWHPDEFAALERGGLRARLRVGRGRARWCAPATTPTRPSPSGRSPPSPRQAARGGSSHGRRQ